MAAPIVQSAPEPTSFHHLIEKLQPYRVFLSILSVAISSVLLYLQTPFGELDIQVLSKQLAFDNQSPFSIIQSWSIYQRQLARVEIGVDTLFIPIYGITFISWCSAFVHESLFIRDENGIEFKTPTARFMKWLGTALLMGIPIGMVADLIENSVMWTWTYSKEGSIPVWFSYFWTVLITIKFLPVVVALWYLLLHPLGLFYSFLEILPGRAGTFKSKRQALQSHAQKNQATIQQAGENALLPENIIPGSGNGGPGNPDDGPPSGKINQRFGWLLIFWDSLLGVQFLLYLLFFMGIIINLDQFDEVFFLWLSSDDLPQTVSTIVFLLAGLVSLGAILYATSKILLYRRPTKVVPLVSLPTSGKAPSAEYRFMQTLPLIFVGLPFLVMLLAFLSSYADLPPSEHDAPLHMIRFVALVVALFLSGLVTVWTFHRYYRPSQETDMLFFVQKTPTQDYATLIRLLPGSMLFGQGLLILLLFLFTSSAGLVAAQKIGLYAVFLLWLCAVAYLGTLLIQFNRLPFYPLILGLAIYVVVVSAFNDNSTIRQIPNSESLALNRPTFEHYFDLWYKDSLRQAQTDMAEMPVIIIATEGGGIRAAAWTTACMNQLDDLIPGFSRYVFGISGVSGGGVGAATYIALRRANASVPNQLTLVSGAAQDVVSSDLIAPTAASMLFRGGVHNFSPVPIQSLDRNRWLEDAWENALLKHVRAPVHRLLEQSFLQYCDSTADSTRFPLLFLNSSVAETGQKVILSPLKLDNTSLNISNKQQEASHFYDVVDLFAVARTDIPFKTAAFLCARFPFVTSGGRVEGQLPNMKPSCNSAFHLIDGGYVENTGIMTSVQLIRQLQQITQKAPAKYKVRYYLLSLQNGQATDNVRAKSTFRFVSEPLTGFLSASDRQGFALDQLVAYTLKRDSADAPYQPNVLQFTYLNISLDRSTGHPYPLGWYLSSTAVKELNEKARNQIAKLLIKNPLCGLNSYITRHPVGKTNQHPAVSCPQ